MKVLWSKRCGRQPASSDSTHFLATSRRPCVSIILPIDRRHPDDHRAHLELKSVIASARSQLEAIGARDIDDLLEPAESVVERAVIAEYSGGLGLFFAPGFSAEFAIDGPVQALAATGDQFTIGPLLFIVESAPTCHVLTVGADNVALARLDRTRWSACAVPDLPASADEALWYERDERMSSTGYHESGSPTDHHSPRSTGTRQSAPINSC